MTETEPTPPSLFRSPLLIAAVAFVAILAALHLPYPLDEDQALFMSTARELADGAHMYGEFWDMKQPGIYWWYLATGHLFSFDGIGLRWMDLCWAIVVAVVLVQATRARGVLAATLAACLAFGSFYAVVRDWHLSQVEWISTGPMAVVFYCASTTVARGASKAIVWRYVLAGAMVAAVALFKVMLAAIPLAMIVVSLAHARWIDGEKWGDLFRQRVLPLALGCLGVLLAVVAWMAAVGTLRVALWTALVYPAQAVREYQRHSLHQLIESLMWFASGTWALLPWAAWGLLVGLRQRRLLELLCATWLAVAIFVAALQLLSYWQYHMDLLFIPVGVLAALGFDDAMTRARRHGRVAVAAGLAAVLLVCVGSSLVPLLVRKVELVARFKPFTSAEGQREFRAAVNPAWPVLEKSANSVSGLAQPSDRVVVWGDQRFFLLLPNRPILEVDGATFYLASQVQEVTDVIRQRKPPLIFVGRHRGLMTNHGGGIFPRTVDELYERHYEDQVGTWYRLRQGSTAAASSVQR